MEKNILNKKYNIINTMEQSTSNVDVYNLNNKWTLWFHHVDDPNWSEESYIKIHDIDSIADFWNVVNTIKDFTNGNFFLMRSNIFPRWEDINNLDGGYWSIRVLKADSNKKWINLMMLLIGETITEKHEHINEINGITISPKINNCVIKIWNRNSAKKELGMLSKSNMFNNSDVLFRAHQEHNDFQK
jgi:translation initiation factor 4E